MMKTVQEDDCSTMDDYDYTSNIPTNWVFPMFSKSRIIPLNPRMRKNAPPEYVYVPS
jgi:hypothetical protein